MSQVHQRMTALVAEAGYRGDEPIVVGMRRRGAPPVLLAQGLTSTGGPVTATTLAYAASLSKQMTAACAALLAHQGALDSPSHVAASAVCRPGARVVGQDAGTSCHCWSRPPLSVHWTIRAPSVVAPCQTLKTLPECRALIL